MIIRLIVGFMFALMLTPFGLQADGNYENGADLSADCVSCHGADGKGSFETPPLAGLDEAYILRQLKAFNSGEKKSVDGIMHIYSEDRTEQELADLATYWASKKSQ